MRLVNVMVQLIISLYLMYKTEPEKQGGVPQRTVIGPRPKVIRM